MAVVVPDSEFMAVLRSAEHSLFRLELQAAYDEPNEAEPVAEFLAGRPQSPEATPGWEIWREQVQTWVHAGIKIERVRVHDDPPTPYQRWERWIGSWNVAAGEVMRYMTRQRAHDVGLLPAAGTVDWWLIDSNRILTLHFNEDHQRVRNELVDDLATVVQANAWRDLAVHHAAPETLVGIASQGITQ